MVKCEYTRNVDSREGVEMMDKKEIARKLVGLRNGVPREVVAKSVGISVSALQMYECGNRVPRDEIKVALAKHYNVRVDELFFAS